MGKRESPEWMKGTIGLTASRQRGDIDRQFQTRLTVTHNMISRLGLEKELIGHTGCVNCLEWNRDGSVLASASDDLHVILWDPYRHKILHNISTGHTGNIFSVKFVSSDTLATCAADGTVRVRSLTSGASLLECACHCGRVKRLTNAPDNPQLMWSAGEDGLILQHDLRQPHSCNANPANVVVSLLNHMGRYAEAKCVSVNPRRPYQLAVGANDFYVRMYDTRMIKLAKLQEYAGRERSATPRLIHSRAGHGDPDNNIPKNAVQYFAPGHLSIEPIENTFPKKAVTYIAFSHDGTEMLVNMGSEQVYLYDVNCGRRPTLVESFIIEHNHSHRESKSSHKNGTNGTLVNMETQSVALPDNVRELKETGNRLLNADKFSEAVELYNNALSRCPDCALLYSNRAAALIKRLWSGDIYAAIRDCYSAIKLDPTHVKSHFRLAKSLLELKRPREAHETLKYFKDKFPRHAASHAVFLLEKDIQEQLAVPPADDDDARQLEDNQSTSILERQLRSSAIDYKQRFVGHCNTTTDIKEANFLGPAAEFMAAGSDDGSLFIWSRSSGNIARCLRADESILNCVQMHPSSFLLATSGIEPVVRLWTPTVEEGKEEKRLVENSGAAAHANQERMRSDPFEAMLLNISFAGSERDLPSPSCRAT